MSCFWVDVNPGMIEDGLTENDFIAVVSTDLLGSCKEGEGTVKNKVRGHADDKITTWLAC